MNPESFPPPAPQAGSGHDTGNNTVYNPLEVMQPGEQVLCEIKRHPVGIIGMYAATGLLVLLIAVMGFVFGPGLAGSDKGTGFIVGLLILLSAGVVAGAFVLIAHTVYWGNRWIVTSDSITQVVQTGLFHKQSSQIALESVEDVKAEQNGLLTQMLNFGVLKVETANDSDNHAFLYCPNPNRYAKMILNAKESLSAHREESQTARPSQVIAPSNPVDSNQA